MLVIAWDRVVIAHHAHNTRYNRKQCLLQWRTMQVKVKTVWQMRDLFAPQIFIAVITFHLLISRVYRLNASAKRYIKVPKTLLVW